MTDAAILQIKDVRKSFGSVHALNGVNLELNGKETLGLLGGNGAGKTTLMNILYGLYKPDAGEIYMHDEKVEIQSPRDAIKHRIGMVHQHFLQIESYTVTENIVLGTPLRNRPTLNLSEQEANVTSLSEKFRLAVNPRRRIGELPMGVRQKVEILKALYRGVEILILDEPTTNLTPQEVDDLFQSLHAMVEEGMSIIFITHKLREALGVCDRISVLREGKNVLTVWRDEATEEVLVRGMVGEGLDIDKSLLFSKPEAIRKKLSLSNSERKPTTKENIVLKVDSLQVVDKGEGVPLVKDCSFNIFEKEILGIAGVAGNGQRALAESLIGIRPIAKGRVLIGDINVADVKTKYLLEKGVTYIPEDRMQDGFLPTATVAQNMILGYQRQVPYSKRGFLDWKVISQESQSLISEYSISTPSSSEVAATLSGGNIQRLMLARTFSRSARLLIAHNPTRGLDIQSTNFVYSKLLEKKEEGMATLLISEDLDELFRLCDRIATIYRGEIVGVLERRDFDRYEIGQMMSGVKTLE